MEDLRRPSRRRSIPWDYKKLVSLVPENQHELFDLLSLGLPAISLRIGDLFTSRLSQNHDEQAQHGVGSIIASVVEIVCRGHTQLPAEERERSDVIGSLGMAEDVLGVNLVVMSGQLAYFETKTLEIFDVAAEVMADEHKLSFANQVFEPTDHVYSRDKFAGTVAWISKDFSLTRSIT